MNVSSNGWASLTRPLLLLCLAAWACYLPALDATFFSDDDVYLAFKNVLLREAHWYELDRFFIAPTNPWEYLPLRDITYWLDFQLYGDESFGFHLTNLVWYAAASFAAWYMFRELVLLCGSVRSAEATTIALIGAAVFIAHPSHVEAVAWVASRKDLIGGALGLLSVAFAATLLRRQWRWEAWLIVGALLLMASFGKATAVTQALMISAVVLGYSGARKNGIAADGQRANVFGICLIWVLAALVAFIHYSVAGSTGVRLENQIGFSETIERGSRIFASLIEMLIVPYPLGFYHDVYAAGAWHWVVSFIGIVALVVASIALMVRPRLWAFGVVQIVVSVLLYLQFVPFSTWSLASERFLFLSVAGFAMIVMDIAATFLQPRRALYLVFGVVVCYSTMVLMRLDDWKQIDRLVSAELVSVPGFHNAKRDLIVYRLLPQEKRDESVAVAKTLPRAYVRDLVLAFVAFELEIRQTQKSGVGVAGRSAVCEKRTALALALEEAQARIVFETDLSLNNILRGVERSLPGRGPFSEQACRAGL